LTHHLSNLRVHGNIGLDRHGLSALLPNAGYHFFSGLAGPGVVDYHPRTFTGEQFAHSPAHAGSATSYDCNLIAQFHGLRFSCY
jgi:hypothetical protein